MLQVAGRSAARAAAVTAAAAAAAGTSVESESPAISIEELRHASVCMKDTMNSVVSEDGTQWLVPSSRPAPDLESFEDLLELATSVAQDHRVVWHAEEPTPHRWVYS